MSPQSGWIYFFCTLMMSSHVMSFLHNSLGLYGQPSSRDSIVANRNGEGGVWKFPSGCQTNLGEASSCRTIQWKPTIVNGRSMMQFNISGVNTGYISVAISLDSNLDERDDGYVCFNTAPLPNFSGVFSASMTETTRPVILEEAENGRAVTSGNRLLCSFVRPLVLTRNVSNRPVTWDLAINNYNLFYAEGGVSETGALSYHRYRISTHRPFDLHRNGNYPKPASEIPVINRPAPETQDLSIAVHRNDDITPLDRREGGLWQMAANNQRCPNGESSSSVKWQIRNDEEMYFFLKASADVDWIAMAISRDDAMGDDDCYYCSRNSPSSSNISFTSAYLTGFREPVPAPSVGNTAEMVFAKSNNCSLICVFRRPYSVTKNVSNRLHSWDVKRERFNVLFATGSVNTNGNLQRHTFTSHTHRPFYFLSNRGYKRQRGTEASIASLDPSTTNAATRLNMMDSSKKTTTTTKTKTSTPKIGADRKLQQKVKTITPPNGAARPSGVSLFSIFLAVFSLLFLKAYRF